VLANIPRSGYTSRPMPTLARALLAASLLALYACGGGAGAGGSYGQNAQKAYVAALDEFYDEDCYEADPLLRNVRREFPYSRFAALAELRIADCHLSEGKHAEAIEAYNQFVRYRPSHPEVPYARFQAALAHYQQIPSEWLLSPPSYERDQYYAQESLRLLRRFMLDFPEDPLMPRARQMAEESLKLLAAHELYVAGFYFDRGHPRSAAGRLNTLLRSYPGSGLEAEALQLLGESYLKIGDARSARRAFEELLARYPNDELAPDARDALSGLGG
jgi:outer membrane protein assembly factor BamD